jgi:hypothetical protein
LGTIGVAAALIVWGCGVHYAAESEDATPSSSDASASDGLAADGATSPVDGAAAEDGEAGVALPTQGPQCSQGVFCDAGDECCFQVNFPTDSCVRPGGACTPQTGASGAILLACSSRASCPDAAPFCCFTPMGKAGTVGSRCSSQPCAAPAVQLCVPGDLCSGTAGCNGKGSDPSVKLDSYHSYCN